MSTPESDELPPPETGATQESQTEAPAGPGAQLLAERRAQGLSLGDVARQLKLSVRQVEALERDEYSAFPGPVFVRGFLRNYAKLLGLDPEGLVAQTGISVPETNISAPLTGLTVPVPLPKSPTGRRSRSGLAPVFGVIVLIALVVAAIYEGFRRAQPPTVQSVSLPAPSPDTPRQPGGSADDVGAAPAPEQAVEGSEAPAAVDTSAGSSSAAPPVSAPMTGASATARPAAEATTAAPSRSEAEIRMTFDGESWVEVTDSGGTVLLSQLNAAGTERTVTGEPPLTVVIGNAHAVRMTYRGKPVDLAAHTRVDVARVTLN